VLPPEFHIGFVGLGKLGLPCAAAMSTKLGVPIYGYDKNSQIKTYIEASTVPYVEHEIENYLESSDLHFADSIADVVEYANTVFVAVQTPHDREYEGITPAPRLKKNFEYAYLEQAVTDIKDAFISSGKPSLDLVIISTVLPGTVRSRLVPIVEGTGINLVYNPYFIAMGTTIFDFLNPEFVIMGSESAGAIGRLRKLYKTFLTCRFFTLKYEEAELVKVSYNTFIGMKIVFANILAEITHKLGGNVDSVTHVLSNATNRLISNKYLTAGMGDGGGCHPRDQIAMSWLSEELGLSYDLFDSLAVARDAQTKRHAEILKEYVESSGKPLVILGEAYKKDINLTVGSPSKLLQHYLQELGIEFDVFDPVVYPEQSGDYEGPHIFYVATPHSVFKNYAVPLESIIIDPWGNSLEHQYSIKYVYLGRGDWG
jgi:UDPglucose 6-dehydrogenase